MIPPQVLEALKNIDWKKVGDVTKKTAEISATVLAAIFTAKKLTEGEEATRTMEKELKGLDRMLSKGTISENEYKEMRNKILGI